jgi:hypothetical protein
MDHKNPKTPGTKHREKSLWPGQAKISNMTPPTTKQIDKIGDFSAILNNIQKVKTQQ